jgi:hypothetical protein
MNRRQPTNHRHLTDMTFHRHTDTALYERAVRCRLTVGNGFTVIHPLDFFAKFVGRPRTKTVPCPASVDHCAEPHYVKPEELAANNGICKKCKAKFDGKHRGVVLEGKPETAVVGLADFQNHHVHHAFDETVHFDNGELAAVAMPADFDELAEYLSEQPQTVLQKTAEVLREILAFCFTSRARKKLFTAAARFAVITSGLRPELLDDEARTTFANELGFTKAALSKMSVKFERTFNFKFARSRSFESRQHMRQSALGHPPTHYSGPRK